MIAFWYLTRFPLVKNIISIISKKNHKNFIGYLDENKVKQLTIIFLKTNAYVKIYDAQTKWMFFSIEDEELLKKLNENWNGVSNSVKEGFDSEPVCKVLW